MQARRLGTLIVLFALSASAAAPAAVTLRLTADPGDVPRANAPVTATLKAGGELSAEQVTGLGNNPLATLKPAGGGEAVPVQVQVVPGSDGKAQALLVGWVAPKLEAGKPVQYELTLQPSGGDEPAAGAFRFADGDGYRDLFHGERPVWRYMNAYDPDNREATYKPYLQVYGFGPAGGAGAVPFITKGPGGQYPHHRGLYVGWNKTQAAGGKTYDFWHCKTVTQRHTGYRAELQSTGRVFARALSTTDWADEAGKPIVQDTRDVTAWNVGDGATLLDFVITLASAAGPLRLDGDAQHAGFQFRAAEEVQSSKATYVRPEGAKGTGNDVWENCAWVAGLFKVQGRPYAVVHMDHPDNPRPTVFSTRDYGRFGPFFRHDLEPEAPLAIRYRVLVLDADKYPDTSADAFAARYADYATPVRVTTELP